MKSSLRLFLFISIIIAVFVSQYIEESMLNEISVVSAIGIDQNPVGYTVDIQVYNPSANSPDGSGEVSAYTYNGQGKTIADALDNIHKQLSRKLFLDSTQVAVIGESIAKSGKLSFVTNYFLRETRLPSNIKVVIAKSVKPSRLLQIFTPVQKISGNRIDQMLSLNRDVLGKFSVLTPDEIKGNLLEQQTVLAIPYLTIKGNPSTGISQNNISKATPSAMLVVQGITVFKNQKPSFWLSPLDSKLYALTQTKINNSFLSIKCPDQSGYLSLRNVSSKPDLELLHKNSSMAFLLTLNMKGKLSDVSCNADTSTLKGLSAIEAGINRNMQSQINQLIFKGQKNETDLIGLSDYLYKNYPDIWEKYKNNWNANFTHASIQTRVNLKLTEVGEISSSH